MFNFTDEELFYISHEQQKEDAIQAIGRGETEFSTIDELTSWDKEYICSEVKKRYGYEINF